MDSCDWLLSVAVDPEAIRLSAILLVISALVGCLAVALRRDAKVPLPGRPSL